MPGFALTATASRLSGPGQRPSDAASQAIPVHDAMDFYQGLVVSNVTWPAIPAAADQKRFLNLIPQKVGEPLDRELVRQSIHRLYATGRFADIRVEAEHTRDGMVSLSFVTAPSYFVGEVRVDGAPNRPTAAQIVNASKLQLGELFTLEKLDRGLASIRDLMEQNGFYRSSVSETEQEYPERQQITILFHVNPGAQAHVGVVKINGNPGFPAGDIQHIAKMETGEPVSVQRVSNALDRLRKKYQKQNRLLAQVVVTARSYRPAANAVDYTFQITPGPKVDVVAEGFKISHRVLKKNVPIFEENAVDEDLLNEGRRNLLNYLQSRGYFEARVGLKRNTDPAGDELRIAYVIVAGARHKLVKIELVGNNYFLSDQLRPRMQMQPAGRLLSNGRFSQALLSGDVAALQDLYRSNGFQQVKITPEVIEDYLGRENDLAVKITVDEGPQILVGAFHIEGNDTFPEDKLRPDVIQTAVGQPFSESTIAQDRDNLLNYYYNHGFPHANFEAAAKPSEAPPNRMDVTFTVREGDQVFVNRVFTSGLNFTRPYVVQREIQTDPGDPLSEIDMLDTQRRLYDLGIFSQVETAVQNPDGAEPQKNVLIDIQEAKRYTFNYGVGLEFQTGQPSAVGSNQALGNTGVSPRVSLEMTRINFRGRNHTITFKADVGSLQQRGLISYTAPRWFNSTDWKLSFTAFYDNTLDVTTFTSQRLEGSVQAEELINKTTTMDYRFTYRRVKASNIEISPAEIPLLSLPVRVGEPGFSYIRNKRDNDLESTKGSYTTVDAAVASSVFGSEADFSRILAQNTTYYAFGKNRPREKKYVIARSLRIGVETPFGNTVTLPPGQTCPDPTTTCTSTTVIPLPERFFSGGGNSHRGFGLNQAGPRDPTTGFPLGGSALFLNNVELRFPPTTLPFFQDNLSFALFEDAGNVFTDGRSMLDNLLRWSQKDPQLCLQQATAAQCNYSYISHAVGVGVHYKTPIGPVRFDFGYNINPPAFPSSQTVTNSQGNATSTFVPQHASHFNVYFSIGQSF